MSNSWGYGNRCAPEASLNKTTSHFPLYNPGICHRKPACLAIWPYVWFMNSHTFNLHYCSVNQAENPWGFAFQVLNPRMPTPEMGFRISLKSDTWGHKGFRQNPFSKGILWYLHVGKQNYFMQKGQKPSTSVTLTGISWRFILHIKDKSE